MSAPGTRGDGDGCALAASRRRVSVVRRSDQRHRRRDQGLHHLAGYRDEDMVIDVFDTATAISWPRGLVFRAHDSADPPFAEGAPARVAVRPFEANRDCTPAFSTARLVVHLYHQLLIHSAPRAPPPEIGSPPLWTGP